MVESSGARGVADEHETTVNIEGRVAPADVAPGAEASAVEGTGESGGQSGDQAGGATEDHTIDPPRDDLGAAIRDGAQLDPIELRVAMQRVRASLDQATHQAEREEDPVRIGRHVVLRKVAAGGFGVIYEAIDPELDRKLAVKVLRADASGSSRSHGGMLLEEARALARVAHPNVVAVFDVGVLPSPGRGPAQIYLAMELVEGESLRDWLVRTKPSWREVVERFRAAGEGLAAAHAAGVVHRDFKPANVLLGDDGRVRVADFGLAVAKARSEREQDEIRSAASSSGLPSTSRSSSWPTEGAWGESGTPAYMAPEQHRGDPCDVRTDVYAFCVSLYQGLYGELPFRGKTTRALEQAKAALPPLPKDRGVPKWLRQLLLRGLQPRPDDRAPDLRAILDEIDDRLSSRRRTWAAAGVVAVSAVGLGYAMAAEPESPPSASEVCAAEASEAVAGTWEADAIEASRLAFEATELSFAGTAWQSTAAAIDAYLLRWQTRRQELCEARPFLERNAPRLLEHRRACLEGGLHEVQALAEALQAADRDVVQHSVRAAYELEDPDACAEETIAASATLPTDPEARARRDRLRAELARGRLLRTLGKYDALAAPLQTLREEIDQVEYVPLRAEIETELGTMLEARGETEAAEQFLRRAARSAELAGMTRLTALAKGQLIWLVGHVMGRHEEAMVWAWNTEAALAAAEAAGADVRSVQARYYNGLGALHYSRGEYEQARELYQSAYDLQEAMWGAEHPGTTRALNNLGSIYFAMGDLHRGEELFQRVFEIRKRLLGLDHPDTSTVLANVGTARHELGDPEQGREIAERVLASRLKIFGPDHTLTARAHYQLAVPLGALGRFDEARTHHERALEVLRAAVGDAHPDIAFYANGLGVVVLRQGDLAGAEQIYRDALALVQQHLGPDHPNAGFTYINLGDCLRRQGRLDEAEAAMREALRILETIDVDHPRSVTPRVGLALILAQTGRTEEALAQIDHARAISLANNKAPERLALLDMVLGMTRWEQGDDRAHARRLVAGARDVFARDPGLQLEAQDARTWLAAHPL